MGVITADIKTAILMEEGLFNQVKIFAKEMHISRSNLFSLAIQDYLKKRAQNKLIDQINSAYSDLPDKENITITSAMKHKQKINLETETW